MKYTRWGFDGDSDSLGRWGNVSGRFLILLGELGGGGDGPGRFRW